MKVLFLIEDLGSGGAQRQLVKLALDFKARGHCVSVLSYYDKQFYRQALLDGGVGIYEIFGESQIKRVLKVRKFIRSGSYSVIIAFLGTPVFIGEISALPFKKWKLIVGERSANPNLTKKLKLRIKRFFHLFADYIVANSYKNMAMVRQINPFLSDHKCRIIYNSIDLDVYAPLPDYIFRENGSLRIVIPASYRKLKNLIGLIEGVSHLLMDEKKQLEIHWYGDRTPNVEPDFVLEEAEQLIEKYSLQSVFTLHPTEFEIHKVIQQADAGLFSFFEGLPNAVCEGMACGKPIIASDVSDIPLFVKDKISGVLCKATEVESISSALRYMISLSPDKLENMGRLSRLKAEELFDGKINSGKYLELFG
jgi:glycosyltransferase involved in cell wall biosynthesis